MIGAVTDQVAHADDPIDAELVEPGEGRLERPHVAVDIRDQSEPHGIVPNLGLG